MTRKSCRALTMTLRHSQRHFSKLLLAGVGVLIVTGGLCLAGKPGAEVPLITEIVSVDGVCDLSVDPGLCPDDPDHDGLGDVYVHGVDGVRSLFIRDGGYQFTTDYSRSSVLRTVYIRMDYVSGGDEGELPFSGVVTELPIHLAIDRNLQDPNQLGEGGMGGSFYVNNTQYSLRWGTNQGASPVTVEKTGDNSWSIESAGDDLVRVLEYRIQGRRSQIVDHGLYYFPFQLELTSK